MANKDKAKKTNSTATIIAKERLSSGFIRLTCSHAHAGLGPENKGGYIKLIVPVSPEKSKKRSISIFHSTSKEIVLDFVDHGQDGPAATWARSAKIGDKFEFLGPGPAADTDLAGKHFRFIGDRTAFPAIHQQLTRLDSVCFESCEITLLVNSKNEQAYFDGFLNRERFKFHVVLKIDPEDYLATLPKEDLCFWGAGERKTIKALKKKLKELDRPFVHKYISSYWQPGKDQEEHSFLKKEDSEKYD